MQHLTSQPLSSIQSLVDFTQKSLRFLVILRSNSETHQQVFVGQHELIVEIGDFFTEIKNIYTLHTGWKYEIEEFVSILTY